MAQTLWRTCLNQGPGATSWLVAYWGRALHKMPPSHGQNGRVRFVDPCSRGVVRGPIAGPQNARQHASLLRGRRKGPALLLGAGAGRQIGTARRADWRRAALPATADACLETLGGTS